MSVMHVVADAEANKFLRAFDTREEALEFVDRSLRTNGDAYVEDLALGRQTADGDFVDVLVGTELLAQLRESATTSSR